MSFAVAAGANVTPRKITVTQHAIDEAVRDFRVPRQTAEEWVRLNFRKARFIANIISGEGKPTRLFGYNGIAFAVDPHEDCVITVYPATPKASVRDKIHEMVTRDLRKIERKESILERRIALTKADLDIEKAALQLRLLRARSLATKLACQARINAINEYFTQLDADLLAVKNEKRAVAKTVVAYM
ncbi:hypothetical protein G3578_09845 [Brevibacillus sp. SYP-B805]|uniref:hypothetical protein n=1 Tax=Brevibacillus sp. SYP-B805 TaxID=1578199 RepID=UPI0013EA4C53|nr:hypothetical protein [Brevibacillus sp. SYP-B805]NGQ95455.1 hypothetical protein [Brevibacillus sp. SYP-B805]